MQYPAGTSFQVSRQRTSRSGLVIRSQFTRDGIYTLMSIRKIEDILFYTFNHNSNIAITISGISCSDFDKFIAFCRSEPFREPVVRDELEVN